MNATKLSVQLADFKGDVYERPAAGVVNEEYDEHAYHYATSSYVGAWEPRAIIYAQQDEEHSDIRKAIDYAGQNNLSISIRSGGHQYLGFSSTSGNNIQLDMSSYKDWSYDESARTGIMGPAWRLSEIGKKCSELEIFFPHGECSHVAAGGHMNTGGYSPLFTPSFGLFIDFVMWFKTITADGTLRKVVKPTGDAVLGNTDNDDLWFAVLGGSPGNLGIVVRFQIRVLHDKEYPESRGLFQLLPFTKDCLLDMLQLVEGNNDTPISNDYSFTCVAMSSGGKHPHEIDEEMRSEHHELYGEPIGDQFVNGFLPASVVVGAMWTGASDTDTEKRDKWFANIQAIMHKHKPASLKDRALFWITNKLMGIEDTTVHTSLSELAKTACWQFVREFDLPLKKCVWPGPADNLKERGMAQWAADRCWEIESDSTNGCSLSCQWLSLGGHESMIVGGQQTNLTALAHRQSNRNVTSFAFFYETLKQENDK